MVWQVFRLLLVFIAIGLSVGLAARFSDPLSGWLRQVLNIDKDLLEKVNTWLEIVGVLLGVVVFFGRQAWAFVRGDKALTRQLSEYRRYIKETYQYLDFKGIDGIAESVKGSSGLTLAAVYVPVRARLDTPEGESWHRVGGRFYCGTKPMESGDAEHWETELGKAEASALPVLEWMDKQAALMILGDPGSGKSTTLKKLALDRLQASKKVLPIVLPLNEYGRALQSRPISLQDFLPQYFHGKLAQLDSARLECLFSKALEEGRALVLLDGLDEVGGNRGQVVERVEQFAKAWIPATQAKNGKGNRLVVTSRFVGYRDCPVRDPRWKTVALNDWNLDEIGRFFELFTLASELAWSGGENREQAKRMAQQECQALLAVVEGNQGIRRLAGNPLLASLLALIKRQGVTLPHRRVELYKLYMETLLRSWNRCRSLDRQPVGPEIDFAPTQKLLAKLALHLRQTNSQSGLICEEDINRFLLDYYLQEDYSRKEADGQVKGFMDSVHHYSNLLIEKGQGQYGFIHLTFEEYLAGYGLALEREDGLVATITEYLRKPEQWHETLLLAFGVMAVVMASDKANTVLRGLLAAGEPAQILFAGEVLRDLDHKSLGNRMALEIRQALLDCMGRPGVELTRRAEAGRLLGEVGDPRLGVTVKKLDGQEQIRLRGDKRHALPDIDWQWIPPETFRMGSEDGEGYDSEHPAHEVTLPGFFISRAPITNAQYRCFVDAGIYEDEAFWRERLPAAAWAWRQGGAADEKLLSGFKDKSLADHYRRWLADDKDRSRPRFWANKQWNLDNHPVVGVSWFEALAFGVWLNDCLDAIRPKQAIEAWRVRLPTEAEWEYAARGLANLRYSWGEERDPALGNYDETKLGGTSAVGLFPPGKAFGLYDMSGNVWEWTSSRWGMRPEAPDFNYADWDKQNAQRDNLEEVEFRIIRGGSWVIGAGYARCAFRRGNLPGFRDLNLGLRMVLCGVLPGDF